MSKVTETMLASAAEMTTAVAKMVTAIVANTAVGATQTWPVGGVFHGTGTFYVVYTDGVEIIANLDGGSSKMEFAGKLEKLVAVVHVDATGYRIYTP